MLTDSKINHENVPIPEPNTCLQTMYHIHENWLIPEESKCLQPQIKSIKTNLSPSQTLSYRLKYEPWKLTYPRTN